MAFVINVIKWLLWTVETNCIKRNLVSRLGAKHLSTLPANTTLTQCWPMLAHNLRRQPNIKPALVQCLVFAGLRSTQ